MRRTFGSFVGVAGYCGLFIMTVASLPQKTGQLPGWNPSSPQACAIARAVIGRDALEHGWQKY